MLADSAQAVGGKLYILGGGWSRSAGAAPFAIAAKIEVPWDEASRTLDDKADHTAIGMHIEKLKSR